MKDSTSKETSHHAKNPVPNILLELPRRDLEIIFDLFLVKIIGGYTLDYEHRAFANM